MRLGSLLKYKNLKILSYYMCIKFIIKSDAKSWGQKGKAFIIFRKKQEATNKQIL